MSSLHLEIQDFHDIQKNKTFENFGHIFGVSDHMSGGNRITFPEKSDHMLASSESKKPYEN